MIVLRVMTNKSINSSYIKNNVSLEDINNRYDYKDIDFKVSIRIELFKEGWKISQIEKYIYKYILKKELDFINEVKQNMEKTPKTIYKKEESFFETKKVEPVEEYESVDDILDKLSRNNYDRNCLTEKELEILNKG